ncbi:putative aminopeptidase npepl1, partial [Podochytrium sp. JEL0797]
MLSSTWPLSRMDGGKHAAIFEQIIFTAGKASGDLAYPMLYCPEILSVDKVADITNIYAGAGDRANAPSAGADLFVVSHMSPEEKWVEGGEGMWALLDMAFPSNAAER